MRVRSKPFLVLMAAWAGVFLYSFWNFFASVPTGDGFVRGMDRVFAFLGWQALATLLAILVTLQARAFPRGSGLRWLARIPAACAILLVMIVVSAIVFAVVTAP